MNHESVFIAEVPSNIALIKYWGKRDAARQWPENDSLSMTLDAARTHTSAQFSGRGLDLIKRADSQGIYTSYQSSTDKAIRHLGFLRRELGEELRLDGAGALEITTHNTFPTGCGIASSASGLGALTLAAIAAWTDSASFAELEAHNFPRERLAHLARQGSGSAGRSLFGGYVEWQAGHAPDAQRIHPLAVDWPLVDIIALVSHHEKAVGSSSGHLTVRSSPLFLPRLAGLPERMRTVKAALAARDLALLGSAIEAEALEMHAVMLSSIPRLDYLLPQTSELIAWLRQQRVEHGLAAYFTIDAGPNVHIICAPHTAPEVRQRLSTTFPDLTLLPDRTGSGPLLHRRSRF